MYSIPPGRFVVLALALSAWLPQLSQAATPMVSAGLEFAIGLKADGTLSAWGRNDYGQLGNGQTAMRVSPARVEGIDRITEVAIGDSATFALRDDGTLWGWGSNGVGQLGDGTTQHKSRPVRVTGLAGPVKALATSSQHALAVTADASVWAWGSGEYGQLGNAGKSNNLSAIKVSGLPAVSYVAAGVRHSLALATDGTVYAWGDNGTGQLGDGTTQSRSTPSRVSALANIVAISTAAWSNLALDTSGQVWAWGFGGWGALGDGSYVDRTTPAVVPGLPQITSIVAGNRISVATASDGSVWIWGDNEFAQFGDVSYTRQPKPVRVSRLTGFNRFRVGEFHVVAFDAGGALQAWGGNNYGQLGVGDATDRSAPASVSAAALFTQVSAGDIHTVGTASDGSVWTWGSIAHGELADGTVNVSNIPTDVRGPGGTVAVSAGRFHVLALGEDGGVWAWGDNTFGALGNGRRFNSALPQRIQALPAMSNIAGGNGFSLAWEQDGTVWSWGNGAEGQLGNGRTLVNQLTPAALTTISGVSKLSARYNHVLAVRHDGSVWAWGTNGYGQLGDGTTTNRSLPTRVAGLANEVIAVATGSFHSLALDRSGSVWAWGYNGLGALGVGTAIDRPTPVRVVGLSDVIAISAGENTSYAITRDGRLWAWGSNAEGGLGIGSTDAYTVYPRVIEGLSSFHGIAGGASSAVALRADGSVWSWGRNFEGQLGDATFAQSSAPVLTVNATISGPLDLNPLAPKTIPVDRIPPFFATAFRAGDLSRLSVSTTTKFNPADVGKSGAVFVTAMVPELTLGAAQPSALARSASRATARAASTQPAFVLVQLTAAGWQPVVNGELIPYASGVLGDQLAAQTILSNTDTTSLNGAAFCLGYGVNAADMIAEGNMRAVATIPDPDAAGAIAANCIVGTPLSYALPVPPGWSLLGNSLNRAIPVASLFGDPNAVNSVWKWDAVNATWQFYAPSLDAASLQTYAAGKGYGVLNTLNPGEGYWINARAQPSLGPQSGTSFNLKAANLVTGWNLVATGNDVTPAEFNASLKARPPGTSVATLWAWDNASSNWYFYAPGLEAQGGTVPRDYAASKGYFEFSPGNKTLGRGTGLWVNKQ